MCGLGPVAWSLRCGALIRAEDLAQQEFVAVWLAKLKQWRMAKANWVPRKDLVVFIERRLEWQRSGVLVL